jgi:superfamily II DNA or RNA helicase
MLSLIRSARGFGYPARNPFLNPPVSFFVRSISSSKEPSSEQKAVVDALRDSNVIVSARPGSGKTTTAKAVVEANPESRILILTYSKRLQRETRKYLKGNKRVDVFTFHA